MSVQQQTPWSGVGRSRTAIVLTLLLAMAAILYLLNLNSFPVGGWSDDAHYITLARSLASGQGYSLISYPNPQPELAFPPGYPLLLSLIVRLWPTSLLALKMTSTVLVLSSIVVLFRLFSGGLANVGRVLFLGTITLYALHPLSVGLSGQVMAESAYVLLSFLTLLFCSLVSEQSSVRTESAVRIVVLAATSAIAVMVRTVGFSLVLSVCVWLLLKRGRRTAAQYACLVLCFLLPLFWLNVTTGGGVFSPVYTNQVLGVTDLGARAEYVFVNFGEYVTDIIPKALMPVFGPNIVAVAAATRLAFVGTLLSVVRLLVTMVVFVGLIAKLKNVAVQDIYVIIYLLVLFQDSFRGNPQQRFLIPILPFLCLYLMEGVAAILGPLAKRLSRPTQLIQPRLLAAFVILLALVYVARDMQQIIAPAYTRMTDLSVGAQWVKQNVPDDATVMCSDPVSRYLYLDRHTVDLPYTPAPNEILQEIRDQEADYVLLAPKLQAQRANSLDERAAAVLGAVAEADNGQLELVHEESGASLYIYRVKR